MNKKSLSEFLSDEYKEFAMYTIENRAIPSIIDGLKPVHRKILYISNKVWKTGNEKTLKIFQLAGKIASDSFYHHGNMSLENAIINTAQHFKNNAPLLEEDGQFGSLRSPKAGASRYIGTKLSENFRLIYKDFELLNHKEEEGEVIEPEYFLPIVPTVLINGSQGIAVGFSSNILNRNIHDIIKSCQDVLKGKKIKEVPPRLNGFLGTYIQDEENNKKWYITGKFNKVNTTTINVSELPISMTYEKYESILEKLVDDKKIVSYEDNCKDNVNYTIKMKRSELNKMDDDMIIKLLKLQETSHEIFSTLNEKGNLKIFDSSKEIIEYFVNFRLKYYDKRKKFLLDKLEREYKVLDNRAKFIKAILDNKLKVNNVPKAKIISGIEKLKLDKIDGSYDYLLRMPIYSLTKELFDKLKKDLLSKKEEIDVLKKTTPKSMYNKDLTDLKRKFVA
jgi:DNA gyrase/topoisomerase IV subunit A